MSLEENKAIVRKMFEAMNERELDLLDELIAPDYIDHTNHLRGLREVKNFLTLLITGFSDFHETIEDIIAEDDKVWVHLRGTGTNNGEYRGLAPNGNKLTEDVVHMYRIVNGKIVESSEVSNSLDLLRQLGVIEYS